MKKIGIMTFHRALNYGAKLQAFALMDTINQKEDAYILDYRCKEIESFYFERRGIKELAKKILFPRFSRDLIIRKNKFNYFDNYYKMSKMYTPNNIEDSNKELDAFVVGSDQVWNPIITGFDYNYFLPFAEEGKAYSYAVSFGKAKISDWDENKTYQLLKKFNCLLTRESTASDMINKLYCNLNANTVLDPVFLLSRDQWIEKLDLEISEPKEKYIFVYIVAQQTNALERAKKIAAKRNLKILFVDAGRNADKEFTKVNNAGPIEFLNLLLNAELVITTSFHALAFSLIFNIPFQYELSKEKINANSRLSDIARDISIEQYEILDINSSITSAYNWEAINEKVAQLKNKSINNLFETLEN